VAFIALQPTGPRTSVLHAPPCYGTSILLFLLNLQKMDIKTNHDVTFCRIELL